MLALILVKRKRLPTMRFIASDLAKRSVLAAMSLFLCCTAASAGGSLSDQLFGPHEGEDPLAYLLRTNKESDKRLEQVRLHDLLRKRLVLPPVEFDHPYEGNLIEVRADKDEIASSCPEISRLGCAWRINSQWCRIVIANDDIIEAAGLTFEIVRRHEIGHCNGWPGDHQGIPPHIELVGGPTTCITLFLVRHRRKLHEPKLGNQ
jgi:hypothetical protein